MSRHGAAIRRDPPSGRASAEVFTGPGRRADANLPRQGDVVFDTEGPQGGVAHAGTVHQHYRRA